MSGAPITSSVSVAGLLGMIVSTSVIAGLFSDQDEHVITQIRWFALRLLMTPIRAVARFRFELRPRLATLHYNLLRYHAHLSSQRTSSDPSIDAVDLLSLGDELPGRWAATRDLYRGQPGPDPRIQIVHPAANTRIDLVSVYETNVREGWQAFHITPDGETEEIVPRFVGDATAEAAEFDETFQATIAYIKREIGA